jgi:hypothetical protein
VAEWTPAHVEERLRKALALKARVSGSVSKFGRSPESMGIIGGIGVEVDASSGEDYVVTEAVEALSWLGWLAPEDAEIVRARLAGAPWKSICWRFDISRPTADRRWRYAHALIAWRLNGNARSRPTPSLRSLLGLRRAA